MRRIDVVNGLRGYAVVAIVLYHLFFWLVPPGRYVWQTGPVQIFPFMAFTNGYHAVELFFLLSGFVLALPYAAGERLLSAPRDALAFCRRRALRLLPLYLIVIALVFLIRTPDPVTGSVPLDMLLLATGLNAFHPQLVFPEYYPVFWTMQVELWLSVFFPLLWLLMRRRPGAYVLAAGIGLSFFSDALSLEAGPWANAVRHSFVSAAGIFTAGMVLARWYVRGELPRSRWLLPSGVLLVLLGCWIPEAMHAGIIRWTAFPLIQLALTGGFSLLLITALQARSGAARLLLANRPAQLLGMMCYSLYLLHVLLIPLIEPSRSFASFTLYWIILLVLSFCTYRFIEFPRRPLRHLLPSKNGVKTLSAGSELAAVPATMGHP